MKEICFTAHALKRLRDRKATKDEVEETIKTSKWENEREGRKSASKIFKFRETHFGRYYDSKEVVPVFKEENDKIVVITVYTFFSQRRM